MEKQKKERYTWTHFEEDCVKISVWAREKKFNSVYGIPRGGLVIAVKLSHLLDVPLILNREDITRRTLVVDDIADSGGTVERLRGTLGDHCVVATIYNGEHSSVTPDFFVRVKRAWVIFPWETEETSRYNRTA